MRLTKDMRRVLDVIIPAEPNRQYRLFTLEYGAQLSDLPYNEFRRILTQLINNGLAEYGDPKYKSVFLLTEYGVKYKEIRNMERWEIWRERIIGFVFGVLGTLLTTLIGGLL